MRESRQLAKKKRGRQQRKEKALRKKKRKNSTEGRLFISVKCRNTHALFLKRFSVEYKRNRESKSKDKSRGPDFDFGCMIARQKE